MEASDGCALGVAIVCLLPLHTAPAQSPGTTAGQAPADSSPARRAAIALVHAINSGDSTRLRGWADSTFLPSIYPRGANDIFDLYRRIQITSGELGCAAGEERDYSVDAISCATGVRERAE